MANANVTTEALEDMITIWLERFETALTAGDRQGLAALFEDNGHWRDIIAFTGDLTTTSCAPVIASALDERQHQVQASNFVIDDNRAALRRASRAGRPVIEAFFKFRTRIGVGNGLLRLGEPTAADATPRAWTLLTTLEHISGAEEKIDDNRPSGDEFEIGFGKENWLERRNRLKTFEDRDPAVLIVGGGQAGIALAAYLGAIGVEALIVDRNSRIGDNWRQRYHSLKLHNETWVNHLPYMPFPPTWPTYIAKDKLANWFEAYAEAMELNIWTGTEFIGGHRDTATQDWRVRVRRENGAERELRPRHIVLATGVSGIPNLPKVPGLDTFNGKIIHSSGYTNGQDWRGRDVLIFGAGNSGHDVAQDLYGHGANVTLVQRGPIMVASKEPSGKLTYSMYSEGPSVQDCDLLAASVPYELLKRGYQLRTAEMRELDSALLGGLSKAGFKLSFGDDETGYQMSYLRRGGGYYLNVGCSELIIDGKVGLIQSEEIDHVAPDGAVLRNGNVLKADMIVLATGYQPQQELVRRLFGMDVAERVGEVWNFDEGGELRNMWRPTAQPGLWFTAGSLAQCRIYSRYLALQLKLRELGLAS